MPMGHNHDGVAAWIQTFTGRNVDLVNPDPNTIDIRDIAHGLSQSPRFSGQTRQFYSVAQHCEIMSRLVPDEWKLEALMHDSAEAYMGGDIPYPLKQLLGKELYEIEDRLERAIWERFQLKEGWEEIIKPIDTRMALTEAHQMMYWPAEEWIDAKPLDLIITNWSIHDAEMAFLYRFGELARQRGKTENVNIYPNAR